MNTKSYEYCMIVTAVGPEQGHWWACTDLIFPNEFTFRLNDGNVKRHTLDRLDSFTAAVVGKRITYKELTA